MPYGNINVDTVTTSTPQGILGAGNASIMKNRIINGAMVIDQRNAGASVTPSTSNNTFSCDRWLCNASQASKYTIQQNAGSVTPPVGFVNYMGVTSSSAYSVTASDYFFIEQDIEGLNCGDLGWGTANAKTVTLSFQVYSSLTGTFGGSLRNSAGSRSYPFSYTVSSANTWTTVNLTIAGDTTGTWLTTNGIGIRLSFSIGSGANWAGTAGAWNGDNDWTVSGAVSVVGTSGATFYITGVQLEVGSSATGFEYRQYGQELALCQRYFEKSNNQGEAVGSAGSNGEIDHYGSTDSGGNIVFGSGFAVVKRTTPTMTFYADNGTSGSWYYARSGANGATAVTAYRLGQSRFQGYGATGANYVVAIISGNWYASAEL
jgi:hypothetical protein